MYEGSVTKVGRKFAAHIIQNILRFHHQHVFIETDVSMDPDNWFLKDWTVLSKDGFKRFSLDWKSKNIFGFGSS
jgi:hypothetical protein